MMKTKIIHNHFEAGSNCQIFQAQSITGNVFAMPGATVCQNATEATPTSDKETADGADAMTADLVNRLKTVFYNDEKEAVDFLKKITGLRDTDIVALVARLVEERKISDVSCRKPLWRILHDAGIYKAGDKNWFAMLNKQ
ncbi:MAG: hypothetical protein Q3994_02920 [Prevotella sp.]|nr:hypothetical protein [Prevotella sp.]